MAQAKEKAKDPNDRKGTQNGPIPLPHPFPHPTFVRSYETDPGVAANPNGGPVVIRSVPNPGAAPLPIGMPPAPAPAGLYLPGTPSFRYWEAAEALARGRDMWHIYAPAITGWNPSVGASLAINLDAGVDLNAFYNRQSLSFFHQTVAGQTVFSGESPDVACHELGHAILDSVQPRLWNAGLVEAASFHESFGDMSATLSALRLPGLRQDVLVDTGGTLYNNSRLSRLAEQLGWAIRQVAPGAVESDCLRNSVNAFVWQDPATIPSSGPASTLSSEPHSFSRVFTSAFLQAMSNVFSLEAVRDEATLGAVADDMGALLIQAIGAAAVVPRYYAAVASAMVAHAPAARQQAIRAAFVRKKILRPFFFPIPFPIPIPPVPIPGPDPAPGMGLTGMVAATPAEPVLLSLDDYGLGGRLLVDAGDAQAAGQIGFAPLGNDARPVPEPSGQDAAHLFVSELFIRDRVMGPDEDPESARTFTGKRKTHRLIAEKGGKDTYRLERVQIDCGMHGQRDET